MSAVAWLCVFGAWILGGLLLLLVTADSTEWEQTEDPACYLRIHHDNRLGPTDTVTRVRYCEVKP